MSASKIFLVGLVTLFVTYSSSAPFRIDSIPKGYRVVDMSFNKTHVTAAFCSDTDEPECHCRVILYAFSGAEKTLSCDVSLKFPVKEDSNSITVKLLNDRALVLSKEGIKKMKIVNLNFRDCSKNEAELEVDEKVDVDEFTAVAYENTYDIFYANSKLCDKRFCRTTYDNTGKLVKETVAWGGVFKDERTRLDVMETVSPGSPVNGFVTTNYRKGDPFAFVSNSEGKRLVTLKSSGNIVTSPTISTIGNKIGTCVSRLNHTNYPATSQTLECKEFDLEGKLVRTELDTDSSSLVGETRRLSALSRINLPKGFILFANDCPADSSNPICPRLEHYMGYRFDENGKILKSVEIKDRECHLGKDVFSDPEVFVNDAGQNCVNFFCLINKTVSVDVRCFTQDEL